MLDELIKYDTNFNEASFKSYIDNVFVKLFTSVMIDEVDDVRHFLSDEVYLQYKAISNDYKSKNIIRMYDELNVKSSNIVNVEITDNEFKITVLLISRYMDYQIDKNSGNLISGNNTSRIEKKYKLIFTKKDSSYNKALLENVQAVELLLASILKASVNIVVLIIIWTTTIIY